MRQHFRLDVVLFLFFFYFYVFFFFKFHSTFFERLQLEITRHLHGVVNHSDTLASSFSISNLHLFKCVRRGEG